MSGICLRIFSMFIGLFCLSVIWGSPALSEEKGADQTPWLAGPWGNLTSVPAPKRHCERRPTQTGQIKGEKSNFDSFLERYSEDLFFQRAATCFPLRLTSVSDKDDAMQAERDRSLDLFIETVYMDAPSPFDNRNRIFPNRAQCEAENLEYTSAPETGDPNAMSVHLNKEGTCVSIEFIFRWDGNWFLSQIISTSP